MKVVFRPEAETDLIAIAVYVAQDSPSRARKLVERLRARGAVLRKRPGAGRPRPEFGEGIRSLVERPYVILYRPLSDIVEIVAVLHGARNLPKALAPRLKPRA